MSEATARDANMLGTLGLVVSDRIRAAAEDELGVAGAAPVVLVALSTFLEERPLDEVASAFAITPSAVVRVIDRLAELGLVRRGPGADGRRVAVTVTAKGRRRASAIQERRERELRRISGALTGAEQRELTRLNEKLLRSLPESRRDAGRMCRFCDVLACGHYEGRCPVTQGVDAKLASA
jgi:MarR family transcriptional regulator, negative regulator of the multidrug operon emrRAB